MTVQMKGVFLLLLLSCIQLNNAARILGIFPVPGRSHMTVNSALVTELARRGHDVTVISPFPEKNNIPNYKDIVLEKVMRIEDILKDIGMERPNTFTMKDLNSYMTLMMLWTMGSMLCEVSLEDPSVQKLIHSTDVHFDLIITETFITDCVLGFAHKFKVPVIQICASGGTEWIDDWFGNPHPYSYIPDVFLGYSERMTFSERLLNTANGLFHKIGRKLYYIPKQDAIIKRYFNYTDSMPSLTELEASIVLVLLNSHFSISYPRPLMPRMIQVGGMHVKPPQKLPQDLQKYLDEAPDGVIYFSMGSNLKSADWPEEKRKALLEAFSKLKQRVLWKWEEDALPGQPGNVKLGKWLPQSDILAHPNVKLFITHGGLLSTQETIMRGVPIVGIPIFGDQSMNMATVERAGFGIKLEFDDITSESLTRAIREIIDNSSRYRENAQRLSRLFRDQPLSPLEQAVFWTEYVIRHKGAPHMRSAALDLTWYQYYLLDVIAVLTMAMFSILFAIYFTIKIVLKKICSGNKSKKLVEKSQKKRD